MEIACPVAQFVRQRIQVLGKSQRQIAQEVGFDTPNIISMIKQGQTKLPMAKVGPMAKALEADPVMLMKLCMAEYNPETWKAVAPTLEAALTRDEMRLVQSWRSFVGASYIAALTDESKELLESFLISLRTSPVTH